MTKKLTARALARLEAKRDSGRRSWRGYVKSRLAGASVLELNPGRQSCARLKSGLTQTQFALLLVVSRRTLEQWEQGRRVPSGAAKTLIRVAELHPEVLREIAA